ncbi:hypothetical protein N7466_009762 [Penicillium verhagenii]|uniref:uncharacterized protein n=1 Tax=Penicillium verhagenii TaxID=1562060 RepID=UPI002544D997|nr:uncharacterized protein N7466_009762 [Penicillium verhagenii]KAJ5921436.1 hypothetical protein N7466_009762 [Penicillium verhagenii]
MKFSIFAAATLLLAGVQAAPVSENPASVLEKRTTLCGTSTFVDESSSGSPKAANCKKIATNIASGGTWTFEGWGVQHRLVQYGDCAFGVTSPSDEWTQIGAAKIIELIDTSIEKYKWEEKVGAKGVVHCLGYGEDSHKVTWGLYKI